MNNATSKLRERIAHRLAGHHILVTGSTGFLAKAFVEKLLRAVPTLAGIHLLVRQRSDGTTVRQRVIREVLGSRAFDRLRASLGDGFSKLCEEKVHVVAGDLTKERFGLDADAYRTLTERITLVVNSAATVTFDERIDLAVELNTLGPTRLLRFAKDCGDIPFMHVSTCYVCGARTGEIVEDFTAPEQARESLPRVKDGGAFDLDGMIESMRAEAAEVRHRFGADSEMCRRELIESGMRHARTHGWNDTYTFTKWIGEQLLVRDRGDVPLAIFRPAIIEGSYEEPLPGWIDGLRMADPIIVAYGQGKLKEFPAVADIAIDFIPVDYVANAMISTLPVGEGWREGLSVYHCASSDRHPLMVERLRQSLIRAYRLRPMLDDTGRPIRPGRLQLVTRNEFMNRWQSKQQRIATVLKILKSLGLTGKRYRRVTAIARRIEQLIYFAKIYFPYTHLDCRFCGDALQGAYARLHPDDRTAFPFDPEAIDWQDYIVNRHIPGLRSFVLGTGGEPSQKILAGQRRDGDMESVASEALTGTDLFTVFQRSAQRYADRPALQVRRNNRWVRYTYDEALHATGAIMRRFEERGLRCGDRVAICGESGPEWGLTYLAAMRAGLTAVPLDPQLPPADAWSAARFAEVKLMCATPTTFARFEETATDADCELVLMREPFIPRPGAALDIESDPAEVSESHVASILFTSGTTVAPKAVQLTHRNFIANAAALIRVHPVMPTDQLLSTLPMYHAFEFTAGFLVPIVSGATLTYVEQLKGPDILSAMQATGTMKMLVVPRLLKSFLDSIDQTIKTGSVLKRAMFRFAGLLSDVSGHRWGRFLFAPVHKRFGGRLRMFVSGGSRLDPDLYTSFRRLGFEVYEGYGLTETSPVLTVNPPGRAMAGSVGPPLPGVETEIRHANLAGIGEVWARGPNVMVGYLKNPEATADVLVDGWFRTGDLGRIDADGYLYLTGRSNDLIVTGAGKNVYPDEVETRYSDLPFTKEICVFGMPAEDGLGETVHAVIVLDLSESHEMDRSSIEREIRLAVEAISETLPSHQRLSTLHFWERDLPKTSTLKAKRGTIRDLVISQRSEESFEASPSEATEESASEASVSGDSPQLDAIRRILSRQARRSAELITPGMHLHLDLGIDSIGKMDILSEIEVQFRKSIDGETAAKIARVSDLLKLVGDRQPSDGSVPAGKRFKWTTEPQAGAKLNGSLAAPAVPLRWLVRSGVNVFMHTYVRVSARGRENIPNEGAFILAPNHSSHLDSPAVLVAVGTRRRVWIAGAEDYFFNSALKRFVFGGLLDTIPFDRQSDGVLGLRRCADALRRGDGLLIFPEGTRTTSGEMQPFKIGVAVLALERQIPIIPVHIDRTFDLLAKGRRLVRPGAVTVTFGKAIDPPSDDEVEDRFATLRQIAQQVEDSVRELAGGAPA